MKTNFFVRFRILLLILSIATAAVCTFLMFRVNVNNDMTKYLPDDSPMNKGVQILMNEFAAASSSTQIGQADIRILYKDIDGNKKSQLTHNLCYMCGFQTTIYSIQYDSVGIFNQFTGFQRNL